MPTPPRVVYPALRGSERTRGLRRGRRQHERAAIAMMAVSMVIVRGGLVGAIINLKRGGASDTGVHRDL